MAIRIERGATRGACGLAVVIVASALLQLGCEAEPPPRAHSESIGWLGKGYRAKSLAVSKDQRHLAWVDQRDDHCRIVVDRQRGPSFARCANPVFSPDGGTVAYWASDTPDEPLSVRLVVGGEASPVEVGNEGPIALSRAGGTWAAIAPARQASPAAAAEGAEAPADAPRRMIAFNRNGVLGEHHDTTAPVLSPDGKHVAYVAADAQGRQSLIVDGAVARQFAAPTIEFIPVLKETRAGPNLEPEAAVRFLADGSLAVVALAENGWTVFHGEEVWASYPGIRLPAESGFQVSQSPLLARPAILGGSLVTADAAPVACWWERLDGDVDRWRVACNGKPLDGQLCDAPGRGIPITLTPDGRSAMYACQITGAPGADSRPDPKNLWVVIGNQKRGPYRFVWGLELTPDAHHHAFAAADSVDDPWFYEFDGKRFDGPWQHAFPPEISPDGTSVVWAASPDREGLRVDLVRDGDIVARGDVVMAPPLFDGNRVRWALKRGRSVRRVIVD